jgi:hypothetical protein
MRGKTFGAMNVLFLAGIQSMILPCKFPQLSHPSHDENPGRLTIGSSSLLLDDAIRTIRSYVYRCRVPGRSVSAVPDALLMSLGRDHLVSKRTRL